MHKAGSYIHTEKNPTSELMSYFLCQQTPGSLKKKKKKRKNQEVRLSPTQDSVFVFCLQLFPHTSGKGAWLRA